MHGRYNYYHFSTARLYDPLLCVSDGVHKRVSPLSFVTVRDYLSNNDQDGYGTDYMNCDERSILEGCGKAVALVNHQRYVNPSAYVFIPHFALQWHESKESNSSCIYSREIKLPSFVAELGLCDW